MERRHFLKSACTAGLCSCAVASLIAAEEPQSAAPQSPPEDWRIAFGRQRYAKLVSTVATRVDAATFAGIMEEVGRFCGSSGFAGKFAGDLDGFLAEAERRWQAQIEYAREHGVVRLAFATPKGDCACPLMGKGLVPVAACQCSVGSIRQMFTIVTRRAVQCDLKESVLRGDGRCSFAIRLAAAA
ncbi:MAG: hypothetical protein QM691_09520 [Opitutaceae bacterium]